MKQFIPLHFRYLLVELSFGSSEDGSIALSGATPRSLLDAVKAAILSLHGDYGLASVQHSLNIKYLNAVTRVFILRCPRDHHKAVWAALTTITSLKKVPCAMNVLHVGGTIRSCQRALVKHNQDKLKIMIQEASNPGTSKVFYTKDRLPPCPFINFRIACVASLHPQ